MQSPQMVHRSRKSDSATAPGGRNQSVRTGNGAGARTASASLENSSAAFAIERAESVMNWRRPYEGLVAMIVNFLGGGSNRPFGKAAGDARTAGVPSEVR